MSAEYPRTRGMGESCRESQIHLLSPQSLLHVPAGVAFVGNAGCLGMLRITRFIEHVDGRERSFEVTSCTASCTKGR